ncbi:hypothetical protein EDC01DRAFT_633311 [Geopyxis carbonaria]|nr:hypothetical protein EDC01DRAFT_633311 [Geopyxis carbonaria]
MPVCNCLRAFIEKPKALISPPVQPPVIPRCLLLGPSGSGKTTFLFRIKSGSFFDVPPTAGSNVEEIPVTSKTSIVLSDIGGTDYRNIRLHFLNSVAILDLSILFFLDVSATPVELANAFGHLVYSVTYARTRLPPGSELKFVGIVLNKQDALHSDSAVRHLGENIIDVVEEYAEKVTGEHHEHHGRHRAEVVAELRARVMTVMTDLEPLNWKLLDGGAKGISTKTGVGVKPVFDAVTEAVFGIKASTTMGGRAGSVVPLQGAAAAVTE